MQTLLSKLLEAKLDNLLANRIKANLNAAFRYGLLSGIICGMTIGMMLTEWTWRLRLDEMTVRIVELIHETENRIEIQRNLVHDIMMGRLSYSEEIFGQNALTVTDDETERQY